MNIPNACNMVVVALGLLLNHAALATPPEPPGRVLIDVRAVSGRLTEQRSMALPVTTELAEGVTAAELTAIIRPVQSPVQAVAEKDSMRARVALKPGMRDTQSISLQVPTSGDFEVDVRLVGKTRNSSGFSDRAIAYLIVDPDGSYRAVTPKQWTAGRRRVREQRFNEALRKDPQHPQIRLLMEDTATVPPALSEKIRPHSEPASQQLAVRPVGPSETQKRYTIEKAHDSWSPKDPLTIRGRLTYLDFDGVWRPLVNVSVNIWDSDTGFDEHLGVVVSDWSGNWSFSVNNDDGWFADGRDIYYSFKLENTRIRIEDCDGIDSVYEWESAVRDNLNDGAVVDFGTETGSTDTGSMQVWNHLNLVWVHSVVNGGQDPGFVDSCFPEDNTRWDRFWEELDVEAQYVDGPDVVFHEYGHAVMYYAYDDDNPSPGGSHGFDDCALDSSLAWSEGWATGFMLAGRPDGNFNWHEGDGGRAIEQFNASCRDGPRSEGRVAAALNDMVDAPNDCNGGDEDRGRNGVCDENGAQRVSFATMLRDTLWGSWHDDVVEYWSSLSGELNSPQRLGAQELMSFNWMPVAAPVSCVATKVVTAESPDADDVLSGLRMLRDNGLKAFAGGRRLIQLYYRHSPELALLLLRDRAQLQRSQRVMRHFAALGRDLMNEEKAAQRRISAEPMIPTAVANDIEELLTYVEKNGSAELAGSIADLRILHQDLRGLTLEEVMAKVNASKARRAPNLRRVEQMNLSEESRRALPEVQKALPEARAPATTE